jgi:hypothetical protein
MISASLHERGAHAYIFSYHDASGLRFHVFLATHT